MKKSPAPGARTEALAGLAQLTPRETDVLRRAARGRTNSQVAAELGITVHGSKPTMKKQFRDFINGLAVTYVQTQF